jgi:DNA-directed RNA polymerase specialized sigma24 family protein
MNLLEELAKDDKEWRKMGYFITMNMIQCDELVQEFYLKMHYKQPKDLINAIKNKTHYDYIFIILKNLFYDLYKEKNKLQKNSNIIEFNELLYLDIQDDSIIEDKKSFEIIFKHCEDFMKHGYKENKTMQYKIGLLKLNTLDGMSMRKISEATGITLRVVQLSIESVRKEMKLKLQGEYNIYKDYLKNNKEY